MSKSEPQNQPPGPPDNPAQSPSSGPAPESGPAPAASTRAVRNPPRRSVKEGQSPAAGSPSGRGQPASRPRGVVCATCGKYHDVTSRPAGQTFTCSNTCKAEITVPTASPANGSVMSAEQRLQVAELRRTRRIASASMVIAFLLAIALCSASIWVWWFERKIAAAVCTGLAGLAFLVSAAMATSEYRRAASELAGVGADAAPGESA